MCVTRTAVITGAGSGIGQALAWRYACDGNNLALSDINTGALEHTAEVARERGAAEVMVRGVDIGDREQVLAWTAEVTGHFDSIDWVFNNAGIAYVASFEESDEAAFERLFSVNFWGVFWCSRAFLPGLRASRGSLVNISSVAGLIGLEKNAAYCATKFAVRGLSETLWQEVEADGVHVASVHPGAVATNIVRNARVDANLDYDLVARFDEMRGSLPERAAEVIYRGVQRRKRRILVGRGARLISAVQRLFPTSYTLMRHLSRDADSN